MFALHHNNKSKYSLKPMRTQNITVESRSMVLKTEKTDRFLAWIKCNKSMRTCRITSIRNASNTLAFQISINFMRSQKKKKTMKQTVISIWERAKQINCTAATTTTCKKKNMKKINGKVAIISLFLFESKNAKYNWTWA